MIVEGMDVEIYDRYVVANQALDNVLSDNEGILVNTNANGIVELEMPLKYILKGFSMFHGRIVICCFSGKIPMIDWVSSIIKCLVGRNDVYKGPT